MLLRSVLVLALALCWCCRLRCADLTAVTMTTALHDMALVRAALVLARAVLVKGRAAATLAVAVPPRCDDAGAVLLVMAPAPDERRPGLVVS